MGSRGVAVEESLVESALRVLNTADPFEKARLGDEIANEWLNGRIAAAYVADVDIPVPDRPARLDDVCMWMGWYSIEVSLFCLARCSMKCQGCGYTDADAFVCAGEAGVAE